MAHKTISIALLIRHPSMDLSVLTKQLQTEPLRTWQAGSSRLGPKGDPLPGLWRDSAWTKVWGFGAGTDLADAIEEVLLACRAGSQLFHAVKADNGTAEIVCRLDGGTHQGTTISLETLARLTGLSLELGLEVFPDGLGLLKDEGSSLLS